MKKRLVFGTCVFAVSLMVMAATVQADDFATSVGANNKAVLFTFSGLSALGATAFNGGIGGKFYLSDPLALRASLSFITASQNIPANAPSGMSGTDGSISATQFGISAAVEYHLLKTRVSPYVGGGLNFAMSSTERKSVELGNPPASQTVTDNRAAGEQIAGQDFLGGMNLGVAGIGGVEFFILKELSLAAEYQLGFSMTALADEKVTTPVGTSTVTTTTKEGTVWDFGIVSQGSLTLSVYF